MLMIFFGLDLLACFFLFPLHFFWSAFKKDTSRDLHDYDYQHGQHLGCVCLPGAPDRID